jgi:membrane-associated protease RseP (regulator of RpoE activity)
MYRSKALNSFTDNLAQKGRLFWKTCANISIAFGVGLMVFSLYFVTSNLLRFIIPLGGPASPVFPVIPVLTISLNWLPYFFLAVAVIVLTHELAHGVTARLANIPVLSTGLVAFLVFFGAFVEPDEKEFEKASILSRLRMLAAGSSTNLITALLVFLLTSACFAPPAGVLIYNVVPTGPLAKSGANVQAFDVIQAVNGTPVSTYNQYLNLTRNVGPNETLTLTILHANRPKDVTVVTVQSPSNLSKGIVGFEAGFVPNYIPSRFGLDQYMSINLYLSLFWIYLLGLSVAIFNMLPAFPFDGEKVLYYPVANLVKKHTRELRYALNIIVWGLFVLNVALSFLRFGLLAI